MAASQRRRAKPVRSGRRPARSRRSLRGRSGGLPVARQRAQGNPSRPLALGALGVAHAGSDELFRIACGAVEIEQTQPGLVVVGQRAIRADGLQEDGLGTGIVGLRETDRRLLERAVIDQPRRLQSANGARRHGIERAGGARRLRRVRGGVGVGAFVLGRHVGRCGLGRAAVVRAASFPPLLGHLLFDLVDLLERERAALGLAVGAADVEGRRRSRRIARTGRFALAQFAQHVELAAAHEIVALPPLDHFPQRFAAVTVFERGRIDVLSIELRPILQRIADEFRHLGKQATGFFLGHSRGDSAASGRWRDQSPNIFCLSSRRCCASSDKVAVGRASRRPTPIGSPVSSQ